MANKQIKDFGAITDGTGTSILVQNNTTDTYNKISAENIAAAATTLSKAITAEENVTIQKQLILDIDGNFTVDPPSGIVKSTGVDYNVALDRGIIDFNFTGDTNTENIWGIKIRNGSDAWGIKSDGDAILKNLEANTLDSNQLNLVDHNSTTIPSSSIELGNHGGSYNPASIEIKNSDGATSFKIPTNLLEEKYTSMAAAAAGGVPIGGAFIMVDSLTNVTTSYLSVRLI